MSKESAGNVSIEEVGSDTVSITNMLVKKGFQHFVNVLINAMGIILICHSVEIEDLDEITEEVFSSIKEIAKKNIEKIESLKKMGFNVPESVH